MKTYWDYSEQERAALTSEQVEALMDAELMTKGVLKPVAPKLHVIPASPLGDKITVFGIRGKSKYGSDEHVGICFETAELAAKFLELKPMIRDNDYEVGSEFHYAKALSDTNITSETLYSMEQINTHRSSLKNRKSKSEENDKLTSAFAKACKASEDVTRGVWSDWHELQSRKQELEKVIVTFKEYLNMTENNGVLAMNFLRKVFDNHTIKEADEWFPNQLLFVDHEPDVAPEPSPAVVVSQTASEEPVF